MHLEPESQGRDGVTVHSSVCYQIVCSAKSHYSTVQQSRAFLQMVKQQNDGQNLSTPGLAMSSKQVANTPW